MQGPGWLSLASQGMGLCGTLAQTDIGLPKAMHNFSSLPETVLPPLSRLVRDGVFSGYPIAEQVVLPSIQPLSRRCPAHLPSNPLRGQKEGLLSLSAFWLTPCQNLPITLKGEPPLPPHPNPSTHSPASLHPHLHADRLKAAVQASMGGREPSLRLKRMKKF